MTFLCVFDQGEENILEFERYMNIQHSTIKFTIDYTRDCIVFLDRRECVVFLDTRDCVVFLDKRDCVVFLDTRDCVVFLDTRDCSLPGHKRLCSLPGHNRLCSLPGHKRLCSLPGHKSMDKQRLRQTIHWVIHNRHRHTIISSSDPKHCKIGRPYGEFFRIRRNCHRIEDYEKHSKKKMSDYLWRDYSRELLIEAQTKAIELNRDKLLTPINKKTQKQRHNPSGSHLQPRQSQLSQTARHWHILELSKNKDAFPPKPLIARRKPKNLSD